MTVKLDIFEQNRGKLQYAIGQKLVGEQAHSLDAGGRMTRWRWSGVRPAVPGYRACVLCVV